MTTVDDRQRPAWSDDRDFWEDFRLYLEHLGAHRRNDHWPA